MLYGQFRRVSRDGAQLQLHDDDQLALVEDDPVPNCVERYSYRDEVASMAWGVRDFVSTQVPRARPPVPLRQPVAQVPVARPQVHLRDSAREVPEASQS